MLGYPSYLPSLEPSFHPPPLSFSLARARFPPHPLCETHTLCVQTHCHSVCACVRMWGGCSPARATAAASRSSESETVSGIWCAVRSSCSTCSRTRQHAYIHACMHAYIHEHTYIHAYTHTHIHECIHTYMQTYMMSGVRSSCGAPAVAAT